MSQPESHIDKPSTEIKPHKHVWARAFDRSFWLFAAMSVVAGVACWLWAGPETFHRGLDDDLHLLTTVLPRIVLAMTVAGVDQAILPKDKVA